MIVVAKKLIKHNGTYYKPGAQFELDDVSGQRLIKIKAAEGVDVVEEEVTLEQVTAELVKIDGVDEDLAESLFDIDVLSVEDVASASVETLTQINGVGEKTAEKLIANAETLLS